VRSFHLLLACLTSFLSPYLLVSCSSDTSDSPTPPSGGQGDGAGASSEAGQAGSSGTIEAGQAGMSGESGMAGEGGTEAGQAGEGVGGFAGVAGTGAEGGTGGAQAGGAGGTKEETYGLNKRCSSDEECNGNQFGEKYGCSRYSEVWGSMSTNAHCINGYCALHDYQTIGGASCPAIDPQKPSCFDGKCVESPPCVSDKDCRPKQRVCLTTDIVYELSSSCQEGFCKDKEEFVTSCGGEADFCYLGKCESLTLMNIQCKVKEDCDFWNPSPCSKDNQSTYVLADHDCVNGLCELKVEQTYCPPPSMCINNECGNTAGTGGGTAGFGGDAGFGG
jgi:hypothetical protein